MRAITDANGNLIQTYQTDEFGNPTSSQGSSTQPFEYTGQQIDANGLVYLRARYYDPTSGRFLSRDPMFGRAASPLTLNRYTYALNNPVLLVDPGGLSANRVTRDPCSDPTSLFHWVCGDTLVRLEPFGSATINPFERDILSQIEGSLGGDALYASGKTDTNPVQREQVRGTFDTFEQARNAALEELGKIDESARQAYEGTRGPGEGRIVGFETRLDNVWKRFRIDFDEAKGAHIHVESKGQNLVFKWLGGGEDYLRVSESLA